MTQAYYQVPKNILSLPLSSDAKLLLIELLDKTKLSMLPANRKGFQDEQGRPFVRMAQATMSKLLGRSAKTVRKALRQLIDAKLIIQRRLGLGKANIYYVAQNLLDAILPYSLTERERSFPTERNHRPTNKNNPSKYNSSGYTGSLHAKHPPLSSSNEKAFKDAAGNTYYFDPVTGNKYCRGTGSFGNYRQTYYAPGELNSLIEQI